MSKRKKKLLPGNFDELLAKGDLEELKAVFEICDINARGGYGKQTALAFTGGFVEREGVNTRTPGCSDELSIWLVEQGADLQVSNTWGRTPLHERASTYDSNIEILISLGADIHCSDSSKDTPLHSAAASYNAHHVQTLLKSGANIYSTNDDELNPLEFALRRCNNADIERMLEVAKIFLDAGVKITSKMKSYLVDIGKDFEFYRDAYDSVDSTSNALDQLYELFDVAPVPRLQKHDGKSPITVKSKTWKKRHAELWDLLVPSNGVAVTMQGELVRISGRIARELDGNGGGNWDADYKMMADTFLKFIQNGEQLPESDITEAKVMVKEIKRKSGDTKRMIQLAVKWVILNPQVIKLPQQSYNR